MSIPECDICEIKNEEIKQLKEQVRIKDFGEYASTKDVRREAIKETFSRFEASLQNDSISIFGKIYSISEAELKELREELLKE